PASDIYSLGRLLQTLLKGLPPPQTPRGLRQRELKALLDRTMAEQPSQRYRDVAELQADLSRWRRHEPLQALPAGWTYRGGKLLRRQWPWALAGSTALLLVAGFTAQLAQERDRALQAEALARHEAAAAQQAADFLVGLFEGADPSQSGQPDIPARVLVDRGRPLLEAALAAERRLPRDGLRREEAKLHTRIAVLLGNGNEPARAEASARRALALLQGATESGDLMGLADTSDVLGFVLTRLSRHDEAATHLERALALRRQHLGAEHVLVARTLHHLGMLHTARGALAEGERLYRESLAMKQRLLRPLHPSTMNTMQTLAQNLNRQDRRDEALPLLEEILRQREALLGRDTSDVQIALNELGNTLQDAGRIDEAIARYRQAVAVGERVYGPDHLGLSHALNNLGTALEDAEQAEAEAVLRRSLALRRARLPAGDLAIARAEHNLARWLLREGRPEEARPLAEAAAAVRRTALSRDQAEHVGSALQQAEVMLALGETPQAAAALAPWQGDVPRWRRPQQLQWHRLQGRLALAQGRGTEAVAHYAQAEALAVRMWPARHPARAALAVEQADAEARAGLRADAARRLADARPAWAALPARGPTHRAARTLRERLGTEAASTEPPGTNPRS
nr:tetratricopeptide repeat-containing serine/threonine-protein kinase [Hydrogenophaga sp.]